MQSNGFVFPHTAAQEESPSDILFLSKTAFLPENIKRIWETLNRQWECLESLKAITKRGVKCSPRSQKLEGEHYKMHQTKAKYRERNKCTTKRVSSPIQFNKALHNSRGELFFINPMGYASHFWAKALRFIPQRELVQSSSSFAAICKTADCTSTNRSCIYKCAKAESQCNFDVLAGFQGETMFTLAGLNQWCEREGERELKLPWSGKGNIYFKICGILTSWYTSICMYGIW